MYLRLAFVNIHIVLLRIFYFIYKRTIAIKLTSIHISILYQ